jgi:hypothetical protein
VSKDSELGVPRSSISEECRPKEIWFYPRVQDFSTQQSLHNDQNPKAVIDANNVLSNHKFGNHKSQACQSGMDRRKSDKKSKDDKEDKDEQEVPMSFAQLEGRCYCCGKPGHRSHDCQEKDKIT